MLKILIFIFGLINITNVFAVDVTPKDNIGEKIFVSGFATTTLFSDQNWYENSKTVAVNGDVLYNDYALRGQINTSSNKFISRLTLEKNINLGSNAEGVVKVGRFPRLVSFYNNFTDSPGTYDTAIIPLGVYNRRIIQDQSFNSIDGISLLYVNTNKFFLNDALLRLHLNYGKVPMDDQCEVQKEYTYGKCNPGYIFKSDSDDYDVGVSYATDRLEFIAFNTNVKFKTELLDPTNKESYYISTITDKLVANVSKLGVKYRDSRYLIQSELSFHKYKTVTPLGIDRVVQTDKTFYILYSYKWLNNFSTNIQISHSDSSSLGMYMDKSVGLTYIYDNMTFSLEQHIGTGLQWKKYLADTPNWNSTVMSISYRF